MNYEQQTQVNKIPSRDNKINKKISTETSLPSRYVCQTIG